LLYHLIWGKKLEYAKSTVELPLFQGARNLEIAVSLKYICSQGVIDRKISKLARASILVPLLLEAIIN